MSTLTRDEQYMMRCIALAQKGKNGVKSNPHVGALIVHDDMIIGEGCHHTYGSHHAEVNALNNVKKEHKNLLSNSTMYVSLEPCNHHGKTPPCVESILKNKIPKVVIGSVDPNPIMEGKSIEILQEKGTEVVHGILSDHTDKLIRRFKANMDSLPYITIKFAQSSDFYISRLGERTPISNEKSGLFTHRLRSENEGILVGTNTAMIDNPSLTTRHYPGNNPLRIVLDRNVTLPKSIKLLSDDDKTLVLTTKSDYHLNKVNKEILQVEEWNMENILKEIYEYGVHSLMVEGGAKIIKWFVKEDIWHEAFIITSETTTIENGVKAPKIDGKIVKNYKFGSDSITHIVNISK